MSVSRIELAMVIALLLSSHAPAAFAEVSVSLHGGGFRPWTGGPGSIVGVRLLYARRDGEYFGVELDHRDYEADVWKANDVDMRSIGLNFVARFDLLQASKVTPYVGAAFGGTVNMIDDPGRVERAMQARKPTRTFDASRTGGGLRLFGLAGVGVAVPALERLSFFAEGRLGIGVQFIRIRKIDATPPPSTLFDFDLDSDVRTNWDSGITAVAGLRYAF